MAAFSGASAELGLKRAARCTPRPWAGWRGAFGAGADRCRAGQEGAVQGGPLGPRTAGGSVAAREARSVRLGVAGRAFPSRCWPGRASPCSLSSFSPSSLPSLGCPARTPGGARAMRRRCCGRSRSPGLLLFDVAVVLTNPFLSAPDRRSGPGREAAGRGEGSVGNDHRASSCFQALPKLKVPGTNLIFICC